MTDRKKTIERLFLNAVLSVIDKVSRYHVTDGEKPDFVVRFGTTCVGVEVTRLHHPPRSRGPRAWERPCEAVLKAAQGLWETKGLPSVLVNICSGSHYLTARLAIEHPSRPTIIDSGACGPKQANTSWLLREWH